MCSVVCQSDCMVIFLCSFREGGDPILLDQVNCTGSESRLIDCSRNVIGDHDCSHSEDVGLFCSSTFSTPTPTENGTFPTSPPTTSFCSEGSTEQIYEATVFNSYQQNGEVYQVVEYEFNYCYNGAYSRLCAVGWGTLEASVLCKEFGNYDYGKKNVFCCPFCLLALTPSLVAEALSEGHDGVSPVVAVSLSCNGSENYLSQCSLFSTPQCSPDSNVARLRCTQGTFFLRFYTSMECTLNRNCLKCFWGYFLRREIGSFILPLL